MKIKFLIKCFECQQEKSFVYDTDDPYVFVLDTETKIGVINIEIEEVKDE